MKKLFSLMMLALGMSVSLQAATGDDVKELVKRLGRIQNQGIMIGHQDDPVYGTSWYLDQNRSDVYEVCGDYPAVMGFELGKIELGSEKNIDGVPFDRIHQEAIAHYLRGGIVTMSWHPWNIITGENSWDPSGNVVTAILKPGELNEKFQTWLSVVADFIKSLKTPDGKKIPVIFRPWHEMNGAWFWWGAKSCTPEEYIKLFRMTYDKLEGKGCDNIVWAYSPNLNDTPQTVENYLKWYPGDDCVDLIGVDIYQFSSDQTIYQNNLRTELDVVVKVGEMKNKVAALTETGYRSVPYAQWFTQTLWQVLKDYQLSYVLLWRNAWDNAEEYFGPAVGKNTAEDFKALYAEPKTLFLREIQGVK